MNIAVIGAGNIGGTLIRRLTAAGHHVSVANSRSPDTLASLAAETGAVATTLSEVAGRAEIVIVAVPQKSVPDLAVRIRGALPADAVVVDAGNYVPHLRDGTIDELEKGAVESRWTESHLRHPVIKAFNNIIAAHLSTLGRPAGASGRIALPVAGDDLSAKTAVIGLVEQLGFDAVDAGRLDDSWRQQPGTPVYTTDLAAEGVRTALAEADPSQTTAWRASLAT
jgi:hypothetical protein